MEDNDFFDGHSSAPPTDGELIERAICDLRGVLEDTAVHTAETKDVLFGIRDHLMWVAQKPHEEIARHLVHIKWLLFVVLFALVLLLGQ